MSAPLVVNTVDGAVWTRREAVRDGLPLYALAGCERCPELVMATYAELVEHGIAGAADVLPVPVGSVQPPSAEVYDDLDRVSLSLWDEERTHARTRLALESARRGRRELRARIAELEAERHSTNEALDDAVQELRTSYAERARRETHPGRRQAWRMLAQAEESERAYTALIAPVQALREDEPAEDVTPQVRKLRALLAGQREAGGC